MLRKKSYYIITCIAIAVVLIVFYVVSTENKENRKHSESTWSGKAWNVYAESIDKSKNSEVIKFTYLGALEDLRKIKQISFVIGSEEKTQIVNIFDNSKLNQNESYEGEYKAMGIQFLDFKNLQTTNIEIEFDVLDGAGDLDEFLQNKYLIEICWSYSFDVGLEKKDTIRVN